MQAATRGAADATAECFVQGNGIGVRDNDDGDGDNMSPALGVPRAQPAPASRAQAAVVDHGYNYRQLFMALSKEVIRKFWPDVGDNELFDDHYHADGVEARKRKVIPMAMLASFLHSSCHSS